MMASKLQPFIVRFDDWTAFKLKVMAKSADHALAIAQAMSTDELWQADVLDGGQEHWEAFPAPNTPKGGDA